MCTHTLSGLWKQQAGNHLATGLTGTLREYRRRGIGLIDPEEGARTFLDELRRVDGAEPVVLLSAPLGPLEEVGNAAR